MAERKIRGFCEKFNQSFKFSNEWVLGTFWTDPFSCVKKIEIYGLLNEWSELMIAPIKKKNRDYNPEQEFEKNPGPAGLMTC